MPLLLLDLDNTLVDRAKAFREWGRYLLGRIGAPPEDIDWLVAVDADGLTSRWDVADAVRDRYRLRISIIDLVEAIREGLVAYLQLDPLVSCALQIASDAGWVPVVVSNGETRQQEQMIRKTGLDQYLAGWVISEEAGVSKPNPRIFTIAAQRVGRSLAGSWVIGDGPETDIGGAAATGLPSIWLNRGRSWVDARYAPTHEADSILSALAIIMDFG